MVKTREILKKCLETALNGLQRKEILEWSKCFVIKIITDESEVATDEEEIIRSCEEEAYKELEMRYYYRINPSKNKQFKEVLIEKLQKLISSRITSYWSVYSIYFFKENCDSRQILKKHLRSSKNLLLRGYIRQ